MDQLILIILILVGIAVLSYVIVKMIDREPTHEETEVVTVQVISKSDGTHTISRTMRPGMKSMINDSSRSYPLSYGNNVDDNNVLPRSFPSIYKIVFEFAGSLYDADVSRAFYNETPINQEAKLTLHKVYDSKEHKIQRIYFTE